MISPWYFGCLAVAAWVDVFRPRHPSPLSYVVYNTGIRCGMSASKMSSVGQGLTMRLVFAIVAEAAALSSDGKFSILNAEIEAIQAPAFPATHAVLACVAKVSSTRDVVAEEHYFRLEIWSPDGAQITGAARGLLRFLANKFDADDDTASAGVVVTMPSLTFPKPGKYQFRLFVDEDELASLPFYALLNPSLADGTASAQTQALGGESTINDAEVPS